MATVLVAEDNMVNQRIYSQMLRNKGHNVVLANHGQHALELLADQTVDLAIIDISMPVMDGLTLLQHLRANERYHTLPIIMLTASGQDQDRLAAEASGANEFLTKPASSQQFSEAIDRQLGL
jgi:CheY-like chemotaxis protein